MTSKKRRLIVKEVSEEDKKIILEATDRIFDVFDEMSLDEIQQKMVIVFFVKAMKIHGGDILYK